MDGIPIAAPACGERVSRPHRIPDGGQDTRVPLTGTRGVELNERRDAGEVPEAERPPRAAHSWGRLELRQRRGRSERPRQDDDAVDVRLHSRRREIRTHDGGPERPREETDAARFRARTPVIVAPVGEASHMGDDGVELIDSCLTVSEVRRIRVGALSQREGSVPAVCSADSRG